MNNKSICVSHENIFCDSNNINKGNSFHLFAATKIGKYGGGEDSRMDDCNIDTESVKYSGPECFRFKDRKDCPGGERDGDGNRRRSDVSVNIEKEKVEEDEEEEGKEEPVAQGQYVVSDTRCPALSVCECR